MAGARAVMACYACVMGRGAGTLLIVLGLGALAVRCGDNGAPALEAVDPSSGPNDRAVPVLIHARGLAPLVGVDVGCYGHATANAHFDAALDIHLLEAVSWQSSGDLAAVVPPGLPPGVYDLHVMPPNGNLLILPQAYQVLGPCGGDGGVDGGMCTDLYASTEVPSSNANRSNGNLTLGPPDGQSGAISGQWAATLDTWSFAFDAYTQPGPVSAQVTLFLWVTGNYIDDRVVIEASGDGGQTWIELVRYGEGSGRTLPTLRAQEGPFPAPNITAPLASGQAQVRIRGDGASGPRDGFSLHVEAIVLQLCQ